MTLKTTNVISDMVSPFTNIDVSGFLGEAGTSRLTFPGGWSSRSGLHELGEVDDEPDPQAHQSERDCDDQEEDQCHDEGQRDAANRQYGDSHVPSVRRCHGLYLP